MPVTKKLYRSSKVRLIAGVCGGLAEYFDLDPTLVRIAFLVLIFAQIGLPLYIIMWLIVPTKSSASSSVESNVSANLEEMKTKAQDLASEIGIKGNKASNPVGLGLIVIGGYLLLLNLGLIDWLEIGRFWPIILILIGLLTLKR